MPSLLSYYRNYLNDNSGNQGGQGAPFTNPTSYTDSLQVASATDALQLDGSKWFFGCASPTTNNNPLNTCNYTIDLSSKDSQNALLWGISGAVNPQEQAKTFLIPIVSYLGCYGLTQFSQCTMVQVTNANGVITAG